MLTVLDFVTLVLATGGIVDCWLNGSIFEKPRAKLSRWKLFSCDYCLNWQVPIWLLMFCLLPTQFLPDPWPAIFRAPVWAQAAAYMAWIINEWRADHERDYRRTKREEEDLEDYGDLSPEDKGLLPKFFPGLYSSGIYYWFCSDICRKAYVSAGEVITAEVVEGTPADLGECANCGRELATVSD
jgi:hypothetical protein